MIGDGAVWIWNLADLHFYGATQIIDIFHAREHLWGIGKEIYATDKEKIKVWVKARIKELDLGKVEKVISALEKLSPTNEKSKEFLQRKDEIQNIQRPRVVHRFRSYRSWMPRSDCQKTDGSL